MAKHRWESFRILRIHVLHLLASPKLYVGIILLVIGLITCYGGVRDILAAQQKEIQYTELFTLTLNSRIPRYILTLILLLLVGGTPFPYGGSSVSLIRTSRSAWLVGQMLYLATIVFIILIATELILCGILFGHLTFQNEWSDLMRLAARLGGGKGLSLLGIDTQIIIPTEAIQVGNPMLLFVVSFLNGLFFLYLMAMICMCGNLYNKGLCSIVAVILILILGLAVELGLLPEVWNMISPLSVATVSMRPFSQTNVLYTVIYFIFLIICLWYASQWQMKRCDIAVLP